MKHLKTLLGIGIPIIFGANVVAQSVTVTSGGIASGSSGEANYTIGQTLYQTQTGSTGEVSQGIQQEYEISVTTTIEKAKDIDLLAFPNPTISYLTLNIGESKLSGLLYELYDIQGNLLRNGKIVSNQITIDMNNLVPASYFVIVLQDNKKLKTFKIIKK